MSQSITIAGLQMEVTRQVPTNEARILEGIAQAAEDRADLLLTPEGSLSGYYPDFDPEEVEAALGRVTEAACQAGVGLALGTCFAERAERRTYAYNQVRVYAPDGRYLGYHAKVLRCSQLERPGVGEMQSYVEGTLRTFAVGGVRFGVLICNDFWATPGCTTMPNPFLPWRLKQMGARLILHAINSGSNPIYREFHESSISLWARALTLPVVEVNAARGDDPINARSGIVGPDGQRIAIAPEAGQQYFCHRISLDEA